MAASSGGSIKQLNSSVAPRCVKCQARLHRLSRMTIIPRLCGLVVLALSAFATAAQTEVPDEQLSADQVAKIIGVDQLVPALPNREGNHNGALRPDLQQLFVRQQITETILAASLDVDSVLAEIASEHARLSELRSVLQAKRDRAVNIASLANVVTGTGVGVAVNALQFKTSTAELGDGIGVGSGVAATILSLVGIRLQHGPQHAIVRSPNMLAVLFGKAPALHSQYPPIVLAYLNAIPAGEPESRGTRLQQLTEEWQQSGRIGKQGTARAEKKIDLVTSSLDTDRRFTIKDLTDRIYMLEDVAGRVGLMKRDLANLTRTLHHPPISDR